MRKKLKMKEILEKYSNCDVVELSAFYYDEKITKEDIDNIVSKLKNIELKKAYDMINKSKLSFEELYNKIYYEIENDQYTAETKYCDLYHFYHLVSLIYKINKREFKGEKSPLDIIPKEIMPSLIKYEYSYFNNVTIFGDIIINFYFNFDDNIKKYLLKFKNDFKLNGNELQDLALYKKDKLVFYSNSHEEYNSLSELE